MITARTLLLGLCTLVSAKSTMAANAREERRAFDASRMLDAIASVETDTRPWRVGPKGERGRCQILHTTWVRYTNADFAQWASIDCDLTRRVEQAHLRFLVQKFFGDRGEINLLLLAAAWHWENDAPKHVRSDYAQRVVNLYLDGGGQKTTKPIL